MKGFWMILASLALLGWLIFLFGELFEYWSILRERLVDINVPKGNLESAIIIILLISAGFSLIVINSFKSNLKQIKDEK